MDFKNKFTEIIQEKAKISKAKPQALTSETVVDSGGAVVLTANGEYGFDLRLLEEKGILPEHHPVRLAASLNPKPSPKGPDPIDWIKQESGYGFAKLAKAQALGNNKGQNKLYSDPARFYPADPKTKTKFIPLESNVGIAFADRREDLAQFEDETLSPFHTAYFEFSRDILINRGIGRIYDIEKILKERSSRSWNVAGCYIFIPKPLERERLLKEGLLLTELNLSRDGALLNIPVSIFDSQIVDITDRLKKATK